MNDDFDDFAEGLAKTIIAQRDRIEALEAALREIVEVANDDVSDEMKLDRINIVANAALLTEPDK